MVEMNHKENTTFSKHYDESHEWFHEIWTLLEPNPKHVEMGDETMMDNRYAFEKCIKNVLHISSTTKKFDGLNK